MRKLSFCFMCIVALVCLRPLGAQEIMTAENFFDQVSRRYGEVRDYITRVTIVQEKETSTGTLYYKIPNLLRIDYSSPAEQVLVTDGVKLTIYLPQYRVVMVQNLRQRSAAALSDMASRQGLLILRRNYSIAYLEGPGRTALDASSPELVTKLKLTWRTSSEGFRELILSVNSQNMIRRIDAVTVGYQKIQFNFEDIKVNQNIPDARFKYEPPPSANVQENFLYEPE
ncbi:MAG: outer membrane lipoprotein carrier protein LolA [Spirochaetales bacterium]|nr:outer membrane lipoprotein carrier protein LolA [Spirochaetales bacterium]